LAGFLEVHKGVFIGFHAQVPVAEIAEDREEEGAETFAFVGVDVKEREDDKGEEEVGEESEEGESDEFEEGEKR